MMRTIIICFCILTALAYSQETEHFVIPKDTSYTLRSAFEKYRKDHPFIRPIQFDMLTSTLLQANICYYSVAGRPLCLDVFSTARDSASLKPAVILIHGGGWRSGDRTLMYPLADFLSNEGYIALPVEYRLSPEAAYPAAVRDIENAVAWVMNKGKNYHIDTDRIAILGCSAGAQLAGLIGLRSGMGLNEVKSVQQKIHAIVNIDGIMDFTSDEVRKYEDDPAKEATAAGQWFGGRYAERTALWQEASPLNYVHENSPPIQFINSAMPRFHAGRDEVIQKLNLFSIYSEVHSFEDAPHSFWLFDPWFERTGNFVVKFLERVLK